MSVIIARQDLSLLATISSRLHSPLYVEAYRIPADSKYIALAYTADRKLKSAYHETVKRKYSNVVLNVACETADDFSYLVALKSRCALLEILEKYGVILLLPYVLYRGKLLFNALVREDLSGAFVRELTEYYGKRFVHVKRVRTSELMRRLYADISKVDRLLGRLTERELEVLRTAMNHGYFDIPRKVTLKELGDIMNLSKVTVEAHLRKVIRKVITGLMGHEQRP